jgi:hypothetical protein
MVWHILKCGRTWATKTTDWQALQAPFVFEKEQNPDKVTLNLVINGSGTVWIDDILLLAEPLK